MMLSMVQIHCPCLSGFIKFDVNINTANSGIGDNFFNFFTYFFFCNYHRSLHLQNDRAAGKNPAVPINIRIDRG